MSASLVGLFLTITAWLTISGRVMLLANVPAFGTGLLFCSFSEEPPGSSVRSCGNQTFGPVFEEKHFSNGTIVRRWFPGGIEYIREVGPSEGPLKTVFRAPLPCWVGVPEAEAGGPTNGLNEIACVNGIGLGPANAH